MLNLPYHLNKVELIWYIVGTAHFIGIAEKGGKVSLQPLLGASAHAINANGVFCFRVVDSELLRNHRESQIDHKVISTRRGPNSNKFISD